MPYTLSTIFAPALPRDNGAGLGRSGDRLPAAAETSGTRCCSASDGLLKYFTTLSETSATSQSSLVHWFTSQNVIIVNDCDHTHTHTHTHIHAQT